MLRRIISYFSALDLLMLAAPAALLGRFLHWPALLIFALSGVAIVPLAKWMGTATEELAHHLGPGPGGLLNATFGNAAELIIAIFALRAGLVDVVKASLTGSIIGNTLFVLGLALFLGGLRRDKQEFNRTAAGASAAQMTLACIGLLIPTAFYYTLHTGEERERLALEGSVSLVVAGLLILSYVAGLVFSLRTHRHLYSAGEEEVMHGEVWTIRKALGVLVAATAGVAVMSEVLVHSLEEAVHTLGWSELFVGVILIPVVGNAAEHLTAVTVAMKDKMDLSFGIAIGSSTQIALFVAPLLVFFSLLFRERMNLLFNPFELLAILLAVLIVSVISLDGESNWFEGLQLLIAYAIAGIAFFYHD